MKNFQLFKLDSMKFVENDTFQLDYWLAIKVIQYLTNSFWNIYLKEVRGIEFQICERL